MLDLELAHESNCLEICILASLDDFIIRELSKTLFKKIQDCFNIYIILLIFWDDYQGLN